MGNQQGEGGVPETTWERLQGQVVTSCSKGLRTPVTPYGHAGASLLQLPSDLCA